MRAGAGRPLINVLSPDRRVLSFRARPRFLASASQPAGRHIYSARWSGPESCDAREDDDSAEEVAQMNAVRVRDGQGDRVDGLNLHDHDRAAENYEERAKRPLH